MRNIQADYKAAYISEYEAYKTAGRDKEAAVVAKILRDHYDHEVEPKQEPKQEPKAAGHERADAERPPENTAQPQPQHPAKKTAAAKRTPAKPQADNK